MKRVFLTYVIAPMVLIAFTSLIVMATNKKQEKAHATVVSLPVIEENCYDVDDYTQAQVEAIYQNRLIDVKKCHLVYEEESGVTPKNFECPSPGCLRQWCYHIYGY